MTKERHAYEVVIPMDDWTGWIPEETFLGLLVPKKGEYDHSGYERDTWDGIRGYFVGLEMAKEAARALGWEGDMREGPYVAGIPDLDNGGRYMYGWKQDNNGTTYIVSPVRLCWLEEK